MLVNRNPPPERSISPSRYLDGASLRPPSAVASLSAHVIWTPLLRRTGRLLQSERPLLRCPLEELRLFGGDGFFDVVLAALFEVAGAFGAKAIEPAEVEGAEFAGELFGFGVGDEVAEFGVELDLF